MGCLTAGAWLAGMPSHPCLQGSAWLVGLLLQTLSLGPREFIDLLLLFPPLRNVKATLQASLIFFPDISHHSSSFPSLITTPLSLSSLFPSPSLFSPPSSTCPLQVSLSSPFGSSFPLGRALTPAVGWHLLTDTAA